jgi:hypothetical protein
MLSVWIMIVLWIAIVLIGVVLVLLSLRPSSAGKVDPKVRFDRRLLLRSLLGVVLLGVPGLLVEVTDREGLAFRWLLVLWIGWLVLTVVLWGSVGWLLLRYRCPKCKRRLVRKQGPLSLVQSRVTTGEPGAFATGREELGAFTTGRTEVVAGPGTPVADAPGSSPVEVGSPPSERFDPGRPSSRYPCKDCDVEWTIRWGEVE